MHCLKNLTERQQYPKIPCRIIVVSKDFVDGLATASNNLHKDGLRHQLVNLVDNTVKISVGKPTDAMQRAIHYVKEAMLQAQHSLYKGEVYRKESRGMSIAFSCSVISNQSTY